MEKVKSIRSGSKEVILGAAEVFTIEIPVVTSFRLRRLLSNVPQEGILFIESLRCGMELIVLTTTDAFLLSQRKFLDESLQERAVTRWDEEGGVEVDGPRMQGHEQIVVKLRYTGCPAKHLAAGNPFTFCISALGTAELNRQ